MLHEHVAPGIHRIEDAFVNWYIVDGGPDGLTIVDAGHPASWSSMLEAVDRLGRQPSEVRAVVLTHGHYDHVGFAERARRELRVPVLVHERDVELARRPWSYEHERSMLPYALRHPRFMWVFASMTAARAPLTHGVERLETFRGGEVLEVPGGPTVVHTPGHTHGHCSLHLPDRDALIAGDAIVTFDPYTNSHGPQLVAGAATADSDMALRSLDALAATGASVVLPGHGAPWRDGIGTAVSAAARVGAH